MRTVDLWVPGVPVPQGSKDAMRHSRTGKVIVLESNKATGPWRDKIATLAAYRLGTRRPGWEPLDGPLRADLTFYLPRPPSVPRKRRERPTVPPDLDKLKRAVFDALTQGRVWADDARVVEAELKKYYADDHDPGVQITVHELEER